MALPRRQARRVIAVTVLAGAALLTVDTLARHAAEERFADRMADRIADRHGSGRAAPEVTIEGYPFLLNAARGTHPEVRLEADALTPDGIPVNAAVDLREVSELGDGYTAASVDAAFTAPFDSIGSQGGREIRLSDAGNGRLRIESDILGMPLVITAELRLDAGAVTLRGDSATVAGRPIDPTAPAIERALSERRRQLPPLPLGLKATAVSVGADGVTAHAHAQRVDLT
ncbi:LmeA family phospholipid-binding protein [Streptomyces sp. NPDC048604]|uniref:LmeA family phospholipid-binding protein n=1 Tax=Streptomyces sp. NPDC048604 TaxID=3365578 RepID=UPI0037235EE2